MYVQISIIIEILNKNVSNLWDYLETLLKKNQPTTLLHFHLIQQTPFSTS